MSSDPAFEGCGSTVGIETWRVENLGLKKLDKGTASAGKFYEGDSYLLLNTYVAKSNSTKLLWNIHFWIGKDSSLDESGIAAYKAVELDNKLGGSAVQYREVQGSESPQFKAIFKANPGGIEYLPGGIASGFKKVVQDVYSPRLLLLKGKSTVTVTEKPVGLPSLNKGDVFILDLGLNIFIFNGPTSNRMEKAKGVAVASAINSDERSGRATLIFLDTDPKNQTFWDHFGGYKDPNLLPEGPSDDTTPPPRPKQLFRISDASGAVEFTEVSEAKGGKFVRDSLQSDDVFLLVGQSTVFLWIGKNSTLQEKKEAVPRAVAYIQDHGLPKSTPVVRLSEGNESAAFISQFSSWPVNAAVSKGIATSGKEQAVDVAALLAKTTLEERPVDDGSGKLTVWVIHNFVKVLVDPSSWGTFYSGDSYILLYSYKNERGLEQHIIYFWLGQDSSADEKGAAALLTTELDDSMGGKPVQVRVTQGKEPVHFRQLFKGQMILLQGGNPSGFKNRASEEVKPADIALFQVKSSSPSNTMAAQLPNAVSSSLNSGDCFLLVTPTNVFLWSGNGSNEIERTVGLEVASKLAATYNGQAGRAVTSVSEGSEPSEFWSNLGGKQPYASTKDVEVVRDARLFIASTATGAFKVEEVDSFTQTDLNDEDVYLLDTYTSVYVWVGSLSTEEEKTKSFDVAKKFIEEADDGRSKDASIVKIAAGEEPSMFTAHFVGWDPEYSKKQAFKDPYQEALKVSTSSTPIAWGKALRRPSSSPASPIPRATPSAASTPAPAVPAASAAPPTPVVTVTNPPGSITVSYEELKANSRSGLDPSRKEEYLDEATFKSLFNMDLAAFAALSKWKKDEMKKKVGLF